MLKLDLNPRPTALKQFAFFAVVGLPLIAMAVLKACHAWSWQHPALLTVAAIGVLQLVLLLTGIPALTRALYAVLMIVTYPIGFVVSQVLMATIYYLVMTPIGLVFRLIGRDAMGRKMLPKGASYWHDRGPARSPSSYFKLY